MEIPASVLAAGWIPFVVVSFLILIFSFIYIRLYQSKYESELCSTITAIFSLSVALFTCALLPVDIFLVSYMKLDNGTFKIWAANKTDRQSIEDGVLYAYYSLYILIAVFLFLILPIAYFFYEEGDEDGTTSTKQRCCTAVKYSLVFVLFAAVLFLVGAFVPFHNASPNSTDSDWIKIKDIFHELGNNKGENAISFSMSSLTLIGMLLVIVYTAYGMSATPLDLIKGRRSATKERDEVSSELESNRELIDGITNQYRGGRRMTRHDRRRIEQLEERNSFMARRERHLQAMQNSCLRKCGICCRPLEITFGVVFMLLALLVMISLLLSNIDKILHSMGPKMGYMLTKAVLPNPMDIALVWAQKVFPLDYILSIGLVLFFFLCSMGGIRHIGIWFCCIRMYKVQPRRTKPQGLLFLTFLLMFIVLALSVLMYMVLPQYATYGSQKYIKQMNITTNGTTVRTEALTLCSSFAPKDECVMTRMAMLLLRFCYKMWFFGAAYYWCSWAFIAVFVLGFVVVLVRKRRSTIEGQLDEDELSSDDDPLIT